MENGTHTIYLTNKWRVNCVRAKETGEYQIKMKWNEMVHLSFFGVET